MPDAPASFRRLSATADLDGLRPLLAAWPWKAGARREGVSPDAVLAHQMTLLASLVEDSAIAAFVLDVGGRGAGLVVAGPRAWESSALGVAAGFVGPVVLDPSAPDAARTRSVLIARALEHLDGDGCSYVTARLDAADVPLWHAYEAAGFATLDVVQHLERAPTPPIEIAADAAGIACRPHVTSDIPALEGIAARAYAHDRLHKDPLVPPERAGAAYAQWIVNSCRGLDDVVLVADAGSGPLGFMTVRLDRPAERHLQRKLAKIWLVGLDEDARGRGIGRTLVAAVLAWCRERAVVAVEVGTQVDNLPALRLYLRTGFLPVGAVAAVRRARSG